MKGRLFFVLFACVTISGYFLATTEAQTTYVRWASLEDRPLSAADDGRRLLARSVADGDSPECRRYRPAKRPSSATKRDLGAAASLHRSSS